MRIPIRGRRETMDSHLPRWYKPPHTAEEADGLIALAHHDHVTSLTPEEAKLRGDLEIFHKLVFSLSDTEVKFESDGDRIAAEEIAAAWIDLGDDRVKPEQFILALYFLGSGNFSFGTTE